MFKIYAGSGYPLKYETEEVIAPLALHSLIVNQPKQADFFIFPVNYEKLYGYKEQDYKHYNYLPEEIEELKKSLFSMITMAKDYGKKIIIFYYFDPTEKIQIENAIIFRTSLVKRTRAANEFALPAYMKDVRKQKNISANELWLEKTNIPTIGFRGQSASLKLPAKLLIKRNTNKLLNLTGLVKGFNLHYNFGYLARRDTMVSCLKNKNIKTDFTLTTPEESWHPVNGKMPFVNNILNNQYNICVSGHGNYSFRLYEVLSAGRIPVFINTNCVLPFEEFIDWKKHVVWIEEKDAGKAGQFLLDFHQSISDENFLKLQQDNRKLWEQYFSKNGFYSSLYQYFPLINSILS